MDEVQFSLRKNGEGSFFLLDAGSEVARMEISVRGPLLTVYHTEVAEKAEGKGLAKALLEAMAKYARTNHLKVRALCTYVQAQLKKHPEMYTDIWQPEGNA